MISLLDILAEQRIVDAIARGEFDHLPGAGQPLELDDNPLIPPEMRMVNRILKNAGVTPRDVSLRKEIAELREAIAACPPGERRDALKRELGTMLLKLAHG
ncbi:MAG: DUF1992 domain-containing protein [Paludibacterium sp.]|uniref:DnaJ family domain-containing protein n=1 Tax=Paludibacterium sp. TaxID=1917523 RepID=UPI0025CBA936|nr:DUF1992 domain-containing protein [Paludibacterium sp.]MBV8046887.1 DUF1992 domain-containing protein [Paludibacterium sp.]MBV8648353.1 DUF1992 domain-containing protein [Paludibacterium sp.]